MNAEFFEALAMLEKERGLPADYLLENMRELALACKRNGTLSTPDAAAAFAAAPGLRVQAAQGCTVTVRVRDGMSALTAAMARFPVTSIDAPRQSLEDVFLHYYGKEA